MRRAILHVGMPRTGTTSLQAILSRLRPALMERGILYPDLTPASTTQPHLSHQHLGEALDGRRGRRELEELFGQLREQVRRTRPDTLLLSYESLALIRPYRNAANQMRDVVQALGFRPEVALTVRNQSAQINSSYTWRCQFLRESRPFPAYALGEIGARRHDYGALIGPWRGACGGRVTLVPVQDVRASAPLLHRFLDALGLLDRVADLITTDDLTRRENRSPGPLVIEMLRGLRRHGAAFRLGVPRRDVTRFAEELARRRGWDAQPFSGVGDDLDRRIRARYAPSNDALAREVWGVPWSERVREDGRPINDVTALPPDPETDARLAMLTESVHAHFGIQPLPRPASWLLEAAHILSERSGAVLRGQTRR